MLEHRSQHQSGESWLQVQFLKGDTKDDLIDVPYVLGRVAATPTLRGTRNSWAAELEFRFIHLHALHDDGQFASNGNACFLRTDLLGELYAPHAKCRPFFGNAQM